MFLSAVQFGCHLSSRNILGPVIAFLVCPSVPFVRFRHPITLLCNADKRIVDVMKVYIEGNNF